jgi:hypothetical protein
MASYNANADFKASLGEYALDGWSSGSERELKPQKINAEMRNKAISVRPVYAH